MQISDWVTLFSKMNELVKRETHRVIYNTIRELREEQSVSVNSLISIFYEVGIINKNQILFLLESIKHIYLYDSIIENIEETQDKCGITHLSLISIDIKKVKVDFNRKVYLARGLVPFIVDDYVELLEDDSFIFEDDEKRILCVRNFYINPIILPSKDEMANDDLQLKRENNNLLK